MDIDARVAVTEDKEMDQKECELREGWIDRSNNHND